MNPVASVRGYISDCRLTYRLVHEMVDSPLGVIRVDWVAQLVDGMAAEAERQGSLEGAFILRQLSSDLQEWAGSGQTWREWVAVRYPPS